MDEVSGRSALVKKEIQEINKNVTLIAVTKTFNIEKIQPIIDCGHNDFGENIGFEKNSYDVAKQKFSTMATSKPISNYRKLRKAVRYSVTIPFDIINES